LDSCSNSFPLFGSNNLLPSMGNLIAHFLSS
jgi:hypothetical protein